MRRAPVGFLSVLFLALAFPLTAHAQSVFVSAGAAFPLGDYGDFADTGWMVAGGLSFDIGEQGLFAGAEGLYSRSSTVVDDLSTRPWSVMGFLGYNIPTESTVSPYLFAGAGLQGVTVSAEGEDSETDSAFGYQFGAGVSFATGGNLRPLIEIRYQGSGDEAVDLNFIGLGAGVAILLGN